jgi:hypothetical protein
MEVVYLEHNTPFNMVEKVSSERWLDITQNRARIEKVVDRYPSCGPGTGE